MNRTDKILYHINKNGCGVEIGPSHNPIAPKKNGYRVHIIDHLSREQLVEKYKDHNLQLENIEEVDFVWNGETYAELTGEKNFYDWIIASHLIEHCPDLIAFINSCDEILKDDGVLSLIIPDKRFCFDHFRPMSGLASIIDSHVQKHTLHTPGSVAELYLNGVSRGGNIGWNCFQTGEYTFNNTLEQALDGMSRVQSKSEYIDVHAWCFTPHSFRLLIHDLYTLGFIKLKEIAFSPTHECEFYITLGRKGKGIQLNRMDMLKIIERETACEVSWKSLAQTFALLSKRFGWLVFRLGRLPFRIMRWLKAQLV